MKNKTNRLHFSTRTLAMVLSIVMLIGSIATGSMLNTFAAYLKDNVNSDAVSQAASEGSDIARSAIPSDDTAAQADNEEEKPDLSGFEENEIVRGMKDDLATTGAKADLAGTGAYTWSTATGANISADFSDGSTYKSYNLIWTDDAWKLNFRLEANSTYHFAVNVFFQDGSNNWYGRDNNSSFVFDTSDEQFKSPPSSNRKDFEISTTSSSTGYVNVNVQVWKNYGGEAAVMVYQGATSSDCYAYGLPNGEDGDFSQDNRIDLIDMGSGKYYYVADTTSTVYFRVKYENYYYACAQDSDVTLTTSAQSTWKKGGWNEGNSFTITPTNPIVIIIDTSNVDECYDGLTAKYEALPTTTYTLKGSFDVWGDGLALSYSSSNGVCAFKTSDPVSLVANTTQFKVLIGGSWTGAGNNNNDVKIGTDPVALKSAGNGANFGTSLTGDYIFCYDPKRNVAWFEAPPAPSEAYYVANYGLTTHEWDEADPDGAMTLSSGTTWTKTFTGLNPASESSQTYKFRIADGTDCLTVYGDSLSGNAQPAFGTGDDEDRVIFTLGATDTSWTVTITFDSSNNAVTVNALEAEEIDDTGWLYSGVAAANRTTVDPIDGFTDNTSNYFVWGSAENSMGGNNQNAVPTKKKGTKYWIELTDHITHDQNFNFAISSANTGNSRFGNSSTNFNENVTSANDTIIKDASNNTLFKLQRRENGGRYNVLLYDIDWTKVTAIGVVADIGSCVEYNQQNSAVNYKIYYKGVSTAPTKNQNFKVYAKDGTITETDYGFGKYADTTISDTKSTAYTRNTTDAHDEDYYTGTFTLGKTDTTGNTLTVTTTVDSTNRAELYVKGWSVNGATYGYNESDTIDSTNGVYTLTLKVTYEDFKDAPEKGANKIIEITPIFYLKDAKTVSFRVENFDKEVQSEAANCGGWGSTLYAYPFYGALSNVDNSFGAYPGQPLIYYDGKYSIQIPIESISLKDPDTDGTLVRGITLNNGYFDNAHADAYGWTSTAQHKQTYDFDDFYKIFNEKNANDIIFRFKYRANNKAYNHDTYFNDASLSDAEITTLESDKGWEVLKDRLGRVIDIFGNPILKNGSTTEYATELSQVANGTTSHLYIVSMGYFDNNAGEYATEWNIYNHSGTRIQSSDAKHSIVPSALLLNNSNRFATTVYKTYRDKPIGYYLDMYNTLNSTDTAKGKPAVIAYERDQERTNNAFRSDGRWYYTTKTDYVQSNIKIQYKTPAGAYVDDTYASDAITDITGVTTGAKAYFTNTKYENKRQSLSEIYSADPKDKYTFTTVDGDNYQFSGWYLEIDGDTDKPTYTPINPVDGIYSVSRTSSDVLVARFDPIKAGTVKISHNLGEGSGTVDVKVEYGTTGSYTTLRDYGTAANTAGYTVSSSYVKATNRDKYIRITLKTIAGTDNTFANYTASEAISSNTTYFPDGTGSTDGSVTTKEIVIPIDTLLDNNTSALTYFSNLTPPTYRYEITYNYTSTRLKTSGGQNASMSYTAKGTMTPTAYKNNVTISEGTRTLSTAFISDVAPHESNFKQILSFGAANITNNNVEKSGTTYTQKATVTFVAQDSKNQSGVIDLPYQYTAGVGGVSAYAPQSTYTDYTNLTDYSTLDTPNMPTVQGMLEDHSTEPFIINTVYGGYFVAGENKTNLDFFDDSNKKYIITAPETILGSVEKNVQKYTIDQDRSDPSHPVNLTWDSYSGVALENEYKRILGVEGLEDTEANRRTVKTKYTYTHNDVDYKCYRVSTETHYVPDPEHPTKYFWYWSIEDMDHDEVARCYSRELNYLAFENYHITPIYGNAPFALESDISTSISYLGESRNQWNYDGGSNVKNGGNDGLMATTDAAAADYIWEDFAVDFQYKGERLNDYTGSEADGMRMGVVIQVAGKRIGEESSSGYYKEYYKSGESTSDVQTYLTNKYLSGSTTATGKYIDRSINRTNLNNKNREDYYLRIANSYGWDSVNEVPTHVDANYSGNVLRVYSYFIVGNQVYVSSNPAYFCSYGIAKQ